MNKQQALNRIEQELEDTLTNWRLRHVPMKDKRTQEVQDILALVQNLKDEDNY